MMRLCKNCGRVWMDDIPSCDFCGCMDFIDIIKQFESQHAHAPDIRFMNGKRRRVLGFEK